MGLEKVRVVCIHRWYTIVVRSCRIPSNMRLSSVIQRVTRGRGEKGAGPITQKRLTE